MMNNNSGTIISSISFPSLLRLVVTIMSFVAAAIVISFFLLVLSSPSFFVFGADPGMAPSPPATSTGEKPSMTPPPTASSAIDKLLGILPKTPPIVKEKTDPKDGDTILSSKTDDGTTTIATKVDKKIGKKSLNWNRGYINAIKVFFDPPKRILLKDFLESFPKNMKEYLSDPQLKESPHPHFKVEKYGKEYIQGIYEGFRDALILDDMFGIVNTKSSNKN